AVCTVGAASAVTPLSRVAFPERSWGLRVCGESCSFGAPVPLAPRSLPPGIIGLCDCRCAHHKRARPGVNTGAPPRGSGHSCDSPSWHSHGVPTDGAAWGLGTSPPAPLRTGHLPTTHRRENAVILATHSVARQSRGPSTGARDTQRPATPEQPPLNGKPTG